MKDRKKMKIIRFSVAAIVSLILFPAFLLTFHIIFSYLKIAALATAAFFSTSAIAATVGIIALPLLLGMYGIKKLYHSLRHWKEDKAKHSWRIVTMNGSIAVGAAAGAVLGATAGSIIPLAGTAVGAAIGAALGALFAAGVSAIAFKVVKKLGMYLYTMKDKMKDRTPSSPHNTSRTNPTKYTMPDPTNKEQITTYRHAQKLLKGLKGLKDNLSSIACALPTKDSDRKRKINDYIEAVKAYKIVVPDDSGTLKIRKYDTGLKTITLIPLLTFTDKDGKNIELSTTELDTRIGAQKTDYLRKLIDTLPDPATLMVG